MASWQPMPQRWQEQVLLCCPNQAVSHARQNTEHVMRIRGRLPGLGQRVYAHRDKPVSNLIFGKACENKALLTASEHRARGCFTAGDRQKVEHNSTRSGQLSCLSKRYLFVETQRAARTASGQFPL